MRTTSTIRALPPPPDPTRRAPSSTPTPSQPVVVPSLGQLRQPRRSNEYVDSPGARPPVHSKAHSPLFINGGPGGGGSSPAGTALFTSPRLHRGGNGFTSGNGGGVLQVHNNGHQELSLHQLATSPRSQHHFHVISGGGGNNNSNNTTLPQSTVVSTTPVIVTQQPESKSPPLKKDESGTPVIPLDGGCGRTGSWSRRTSSSTPVSITPTSVRTTSSTAPTNLFGGGGDGHGGAPPSPPPPHEGEGIICSECGKCRCSACVERHELPCRAWCCNDKYEVTAAKCVEACTCFCAVKCLFFHCRRGEEEEEDNECYENPCGCCGTPRCCLRWTMLGLVTATCLPCLALYWPARACLSAATATYNACCVRHKGCQCDRANSATASSGQAASPCSGSAPGSNVAASGKCGSSSVLSNVGGGGGGGNVMLKNSSKHSQTRRLLIESDSSSA